MGGEVEHQDRRGENRGFGMYLRKVREDRKLSLDAVEEMTAGYHERITKSHLSRIENGQAVPTFPRMFALSQIYGLPISSLAEKFEIDLQRQMMPVDLDDKTPSSVLEEFHRLKTLGDYRTALPLLATAIDCWRVPGDLDLEMAYSLRLAHVDCMTHLGRYESAKVECEQLLSNEQINPIQRLSALHSFVICCYRLERFTIARMALQQVEKELEDKTYPARIRADLLANSAAVSHALRDYLVAAKSFDRARVIYAEINEEFEACRARINLGQSLLSAEKLRQAAPQITAGLSVAENRGYGRLRALAMSHLAVIAFRRGDLAACESHALRSNALARVQDYFTLVFRNCYYLREIAESRGDATSMHANERTLKAYLRRIEPNLPEAALYRAKLSGGRE